jgi:DNA-binding response OmpR family regulator
VSVPRKVEKIQKMKKNILVVDDDREILTSLRNGLEKQGYKVMGTETGKRATAAFIKSCYDEPFDLILLDIGLPDMSGIDVLQIIRQEEEIRGLKYENGVKIIIQTGRKHSWMDGFNRGCDDFILKPYSFDDLMGKIKKKLVITKDDPTK